MIIYAVICLNRSIHDRFELSLYLKINRDEYGPNNLGGRSLDHAGQGRAFQLRGHVGRKRVQFEKIEKAGLKLRVAKGGRMAFVDEYLCLSSSKDWYDFVCGGCDMGYVS